MGRTPDWFCIIGHWTAYWFYKPQNQAEPTLPLSTIFCQLKFFYVHRYPNLDILDVILTYIFQNLQLSFSGQNWFFLRDFLQEYLLLGFVDLYRKYRMNFTDFEILKLWELNGLKGSCRKIVSSEFLSRWNSDWLCKNLDEFWKVLLRSIPFMAK